MIQDSTGSSILVTDGLENCEGDPCRTVRDTNAAGIYDVVVGSVEVAGSPKRSSPGIEVKPGDHVDVAYSINSGDLPIGIRRGDDVADAVVAVRDLATNQQVASARTHPQARTNPRAFVLPPGQYRVEIAEIRREKRAGVEPAGWVDTPP